MRVRSSHVTSVIGALLLAGSLWQAWFTLHVPLSLRTGLGAEAARVPGVFGVLLRGAVAQVPDKLGVTAWQAFDGRDSGLLAMALVAVVIVGLAALGSAGPRAAGWVAAIAGGVALAMTLPEIASPPGRAGFVTVAWGAYAGAAGAVLMLLGGIGAALGEAPTHGPAPAVATAAGAPTAAPRSSSRPVPPWELSGR